MPNPVPGRALTVEAVDDMRRVHCRFYSYCLDRTFTQEWPGFSCKACDAYVPITPVEARADMVGIGNLLYAMREQGPLHDNKADFDGEGV